MADIRRESNHVVNSAFVLGKHVALPLYSKVRYEGSRFFVGFTNFGGGSTRQRRLGVLNGRNVNDIIYFLSKIRIEHLLGNECLRC